MQTEAINRKGLLLRICEIYASIQGEGLLTGTPSIFVRTSGCNLRCWFCDTPFASWNPEGDHRTTKQLIDEIHKFSDRHVVLTGGEPMIYPAVVELAHGIRQAGKHLTIETAGTIWHPAECDLWSISPKLSGSAPREAGTWQRAHHQRRDQPQVVANMMQHNYQLKFVVNDHSEATEVLQYLDRLKNFDPSRVLLMPQGTTQEQLDRQAQWLEPWCQRHGLVYCPRAHILWFGNRRGT